MDGFAIRPNEIPHEGLFGDFWKAGSDQLTRLHFEVVAVPYLLLPFRQGGKELRTDDVFNANQTGITLVLRSGTGELGTLEAIGGYDAFHLPMRKHARPQFIGHATSEAMVASELDQS